MIARQFIISLFIILGSSSVAYANSDSQLWSQIHQAAANGKNDWALKKFKTLVDRKHPGIDADEIALTHGRLLYQAGNFAGAVQAYSKVPRDSDFWLASVEERAWAKIQSGDVNQAIADSKTLMSPLFEDIAGPESYFVSSYVAHRTCDFKNVFEISDKFKKNNKLRIVHLEKMSKMQKTRGIADFIGALREKGLKKALSSQVISFFPDHFYKDKKIQRLAKKASSIGFNEIAFRKRLAELAKLELKHYKDVIAKLLLIEGDVIQRLFLDKSLAGNRSQVGSGIQSGKYDLKFPYDERDVWIDEIDNLKVSAKNCPEIPKGVKI